MPTTLTTTLAGQSALEDPVTGLVHLGQGRYYDPSLGRPLQPNPGGGVPVLPQSLNRYAATPLGQPGSGVDNGLNDVVIASYVVGFGKSLGQEFGSHLKIGIFGRDVSKTATRFTGETMVHVEASASALKANRTRIKGLGGILHEETGNILRMKANYKLSKAKFSQHSFKFSQLGDDTIETIKTAGTFKQTGFYRVKVTAEQLTESFTKSARVARFSTLKLLFMGGVADGVLGGAFQLYDDWNNPYLNPEKRFVRIGVATLGNGGTAIGFGLIGSSLSCGPWAPVCAVGAGLVGIFIWNTYAQPVVFDLLGANPERNLKALPSP